MVINKEIEEVKLMDIISHFLQDIKFISGLTIIFSVLSIVYTLSLDNIYKSEVSLSPIEKSTSGSKSVGGLLSLAGYDLGTDEAESIEVHIEYLKSRDFNKYLMSLPDILPKLMASESFNSESKQIIYNEELYDPVSSSWKEGKEPSFLIAHKKLKEDLEVTIDDSGIVRVSFQHISPVFAKYFLDVILNEFNIISSEKAQRKIERSLDYLYKKYDEIKTNSVKTSIGNLIEEQLKNQMMIKSREYHVFDIIDPPHLPEEKSAPNRTQTVIFITLLGFFIASFISLIRLFLRSK
tara:strand:+ start:69 stop:950 length:882 start_codon:yes stop_codon:yes gene_type:complete